MPFLVEATPKISIQKGLLVANILRKAAGGKVPVGVMNTCEKAIKLISRARVAVVSKSQRICPKEVVGFDEMDGVLHVEQCSGY